MVTLYLWFVDGVALVVVDRFILGLTFLLFNHDTVRLLHRVVLDLALGVVHSVALLVVDGGVLRLVLHLALLLRHSLVLSPSNISQQLVLVIFPN